MESKNSLRGSTHSAYHAASSMPVLGIDVSKRTLDACLLTDGDRHHCTVPNDDAGHHRLHAWASNVAAVYCACLESTGSYGEAIAKHLFAEGVAVSLVNPSQTAAFARAQMLRTKTDRVDAESIARFALAMLSQGELPRYEPRSPEQEALQELVRYRDALVAQRLQLTNRDQDAELKAVKRSNKKLVEAIDREIKEAEREIKKLLEQHERLGRQYELLTSIPGVGAVTAAVILSELPPVERFEHPAQVAAYAGVTPRIRHSGSRKPLSQLITKTGNAFLRRTIYMAALTAKRLNPHLKAMAERLHSKGKAPKKVIVAIMRKLMHLIYAILRDQVPFTTDHSATDHKKVIAPAN